MAKSPLFPTQMQSAAFWEALGRAVGAFGFLEEILGKAIFTVASQKPIDTDRLDALNAWRKVLEKALTDTLNPLADEYLRVMKGHPAKLPGEVQDLVDSIKSAAVIRNALCHGSWQPTGPDVARPFYVTKKLEIFSTDVTLDFLNQTRIHVGELALEVVSQVRGEGIEFFPPKPEDGA